MINYNKLKNQNSGQIGIFVVIAVIIIILMIFLLSSSNSKNIENLENSNTGVKSGQGELFPLKTSIDTCLETQLKLGLTISGLRGGLIYSDSERYTFSNGIDNYDQNLLSNFNLNQNYLSQNLIHSQYDVFIPRYNQTYEILIDGTPKTIYSHSIEEDFKRFLLANLHNCLDFKDLTDEYKITQNIFFGNLIGFDATSKTLKSTPFDAEIDDTISFTIDGKIYYGSIVPSPSEDYLLAQLNQNPFTSQTRFNDITIINLNNSVEIEIIFEDDKVSTKLTYPITLERGETIVYFKNTIVSVQNRIKKILELGNFLLGEKVFDRDIDFTSETSLAESLKFAPFYNDLEPSEIDFQISISSDELDYKLKTLTIVDNKYKLFSNPYIVNFGYENSAPDLNLEIGTYDYLHLINPTENYFITNIDESSTINLKDFLSDNQLFDNFESYFVEQSIDNGQYNFRLDELGILYFIAKSEGIYTFNIEVTDGETINIYPLTIDAGLSNSFESIDLSKYKLLFVDSYTIGQTNLQFTNQFENFTGTLIEDPLLVSVNFNSRGIFNTSLPLPTYFNNLKIEGTFTNDDYEILDLGNDQFAAKIVNPAADLLILSSNAQRSLFKNRGIPKTVDSIKRFGPPGMDVIIDRHSGAEGVNSYRHYTIHLEHVYNSDGSTVNTKFDYYNYPPTLDDNTPISVGPYNMTNKTPPRMYAYAGADGTDADFDELDWITDSTDSRFSISRSGYARFYPTGIGTYTFRVFQTDGGLNSSKKTISFEVIK
jgi:hypothetical protein